MFEYEGRALTNAEEVYRAIKMEPRQEALVKEISNVVGPEVGLDPIPCRGFLLMAVRKWQIAHAKTVDVLAHLAPKERASAAREIADQFAGILREHLRDQERRRHLDEAVEKGFAVYLAKYNQRAPT